MIRAGAAAALAIATLAAHQERTPDALPAGLVALEVGVSRADGRVMDLRREDFTVTIDGTATAIEFFSAGAAPLRLVLLVDGSSSVRVDPDAVKQAVQDLIAGLEPGDRARIGWIARAPSLGLPFTGDRNSLRTAASLALRRPDEERFGPSPIWDAIDLAVTALEPEPGRRGIVLMTDGRSSGNRHGLAEAAEHAAAANVIVSSIAISSEIDLVQTPGTVAAVHPERLLARLALLSGGHYEVHDGDPGNRLTAQFARAIDDLRNRYTLGIRTASPDGRAHRVEVRVARDGAEVRVRNSYVATAPGGGRAPVASRQFPVSSRSVRLQPDHPESPVPDPGSRQVHHPTVFPLFCSSSHFFSGAK